MTKILKGFVSKFQTREELWCLRKNAPESEKRKIAWEGGESRRGGGKGTKGQEVEGAVRSGRPREDQV